MGLDMMAHSRRDLIVDQTDFDKSEDDELIFDWRKHPNLHGWMENLYREKGGKADDFNLVTLKLHIHDINNLEKAIREKRLPHTEGFFFGRSDGSEMEEDLNFIKKAKEEIQKGNSVYYSSWW